MPPVAFARPRAVRSGFAVDAIEERVGFVRREAGERFGDLAPVVAKLASS